MILFALSEPSSVITFFPYSVTGIGFRALQKQLEKAEAEKNLSDPTQTPAPAG